MIDLAKKKCQACSGFSEALDKASAEKLLAEIPGWTTDGKWIRREFQFKNFSQVMFFVNAVAFIAYQEGHHPDVEFGYNYVHLRYTTHELKGLSENDFICAAKVNQLISDS